MRKFLYYTTAFLLLAGVASAQLGGSGLSAITRFRDLVDVSKTAPTNGQVPVYNSSTGKWTPGAAGGSSGVTSASNITDNRLVRGDGGAKGIQESAITVADTSGDMSGIGNITPTNGSALRTTTTSGNTLLLQAYDNNTGPAYQTFCTLTAGNSPTMGCTDLALTTPTLGVATATSVNGTTIPSSKTLVVTTDKLSVLAATSSSELASVLSDESGSGSVAYTTSPTFVTPAIGAATATSINKVALTAPATSATLTIADGATLTATASTTVPIASQAITLSGPSSARTYTLPDAAATLGYTCIRLYPTTVAGDLVAGTKLATAMVRQAMTVTNVYANVNTAGTTSAPTFDINEAGTSIISTKLTIDATETDSSTAATPAVISDSSIAANAQLSVDVDSADSGNTAVGAEVDVCGYPTGAPQ